MFSVATCQNYVILAFAIFCFWSERRCSLAFKWIHLRWKKRSSWIIESLFMDEVELDWWKSSNIHKTSSFVNGWDWPPSFLTARPDNVRGLRRSVFCPPWLKCHFYLLLGLRPLNTESLKLNTFIWIGSGLELQTKASQSRSWPLLGPSHI